MRVVRLASIAWLGAACALSAHALGQAAAAPVQVARGAGAEACPDGAALNERVRALRGAGAEPASEAYAVAFAREPDGFAASIRAPGGAERVLRDRSDSCAGLAQATAVTLALLLDPAARARVPDSDPAEPSQPGSAAQSTAPAPLPAPRAAVALPPASDRSARDRAADAADGATRAPDRVRGSLALGGAGLVGVVRIVSPALAAEVGIEAGGLHAGLGALWAPPQTIDLAPGTVREWMWSGIARVCAPLWRAPMLGLAGCSGLHLSALHAEARGYTRDGGATRHGIALPLELALSSPPAAFGWELGVAALLPLRRDDFRVDGAGVAYASLPVGVLVTLRALGAVGF
jgi:hypothetical protein